jgi:valyl-tRNA synthetase
LQSDDATAAMQLGTRRTLVDMLEALLRLLHPLMPFITEEIWQQVAPRAGLSGETIMLQPFPEPRQDVDVADAVADIEWVRNFILGIRQIRGEMDISPGKALPVLLQGSAETDRTRSTRYANLLERVGRVESVTVLGDEEQPPAAATALLGDMRLLVPMKGIIDIDAEKARLEKQKEKVTAELEKARNKLGNENFVKNAPAEVVAKERARAAEFEKTIAQLDEQLGKLLRI